MDHMRREGLDNVGNLFVEDLGLDTSLFGVVGRQAVHGQNRQADVRLVRGIRRVGPDGSCEWAVGGRWPSADGCGRVAVTTGQAQENLEQVVGRGKERRSKVSAVGRGAAGRSTLPSLENGREGWWLMSADAHKYISLPHRDPQSRVCRASRRPCQRDDQTAHRAIRRPGWCGTIWAR